MIVTFKNKMIVTFGPWLKGEGAWSAHLPLRTLDERRRTTTTKTKQALRALAQGEGAWSAHLPLRAASEITVTLYIPTTTTTNDDDERRRRTTTTNDDDEDDM